MLTVTDSAATEIRHLVAEPHVPDEGGVRISSEADGDLSLALVAGGIDGDAVVENDGARVFVDSEANALVDDKQLDAGHDDQGRLQFVLGEQD